MEGKHVYDWILWNSPPPSVVAVNYITVRMFLTRIYKKNDIIKVTDAEEWISV